jgi:hypothetical protein
MKSKELAKMKSLATELLSCVERYESSMGAGTGTDETAALGDEEDEMPMAKAALPASPEEEGDEEGKDLAVKSLKMKLLGKYK